MNTQTITVEAVNVKDKKDFIYKKGNRKGEKGFLYPIGLNIGGKWINGTAFSEEEADIFRKLEKGNKITLVIYEEEYNGKVYEKFKLPNDKDQMKSALEQAQLDIAALQEIVKQLVVHTKLKYVAPKKPQGQINGEMARKQSESAYDNTDLPF